MAIVAWITGTLLTTMLYLLLSDSSKFRVMNILYEYSNTVYSF